MMEFQSKTPGYVHNKVGIWIFEESKMESRRYFYRSARNDAPNAVPKQNLCSLHCVMSPQPPNPAVCFVHALK